MTRPQFSRKGEAPTAKELELMAAAMAHHIRGYPEAASG